MDNKEVQDQGEKDKASIVEEMMKLKCKDEKEEEDDEEKEDLREGPMENYALHKKGTQKEKNTKQAKLEIDELFSSGELEKLALSATSESNLFTTLRSTPINISVNDDTQKH